MTNTTNAASAHAACTHPKTKVDRARCRKARATSPTRTNLIDVVTAKGSKVIHRVVDGTTFACTKKTIKADAIFTTAPADVVTCKNCVKLPA